MKFPADPTNPYIKQSAHTFSEPNRANQGTAAGSSADASRPRPISPRSAALTVGISSGRLRNHIQNGAQTRMPKPANSQKGVVHVPQRSNSPRNRKGPPAPPSRLNIQTVPWADARSVIGVQSVITRAQTGKNPAWKTP